MATAAIKHLDEAKRYDLYSSITQGLSEKTGTVTELCAKYAADNSIPLDVCQAAYLSTQAEQTKLRSMFERLLKEAATKSVARMKDFDGIKAPTKKLFEDWEIELIDLARKVNPTMPKTTLAKYVHDIMPHRTWKSYAVFLDRIDDRLPKPQSLKDGDIVEATVSRILDRGAMLITENGERGLLHISEMTDKYIDNIYNYLDLGHRVTVMVIRDAQGRLAFSAKRVRKLQPIPQDAMPELPALRQVPPRPVAAADGDAVTKLNRVIDSMEATLEGLRDLRASFGGMIEKASRFDKLNHQLIELLK